MKSRYPFDPYDWATITPLYAALSETPLSGDDFMNWLDAWNTLDIAVHDAWTWLKRPAYYDTRDRLPSVRIRRLPSICSRPISGSEIP